MGAAIGVTEEVVGHVAAAANEETESRTAAHHFRDFMLGHGDEVEFA